MTDIKEINNYIEEIVNALIPDPTDSTDTTREQIRNTIIDNFDNYSNKEKLSFIKNTDKHLANLKIADDKIKQLKTQMVSTGGYNVGGWNILMEGLSKLQVLSLINKTASCKDTTDAIITALNEKIKAVNTVIEENLNQTGGNIKSYKHKYLKYKSKYLRIKNNM